MKNTQKGITLIALIITIIVLLILAVVAIGAVQNDGIIDHAKNAKVQYGTAQDNEKTTLQGYLDKLNNNVPTGVGTGTGEKKDMITFTIDGVNYSVKAKTTWKQWIDLDEYDSGDCEYTEEGTVIKDEGMSAIRDSKTGDKVSPSDYIEAKNYATRQQQGAVSME